MADVDDDTVARWRASPRLAERIAARIAAELRGQPRWQPVQGNFRLAARMNVSEGTARRAKALLADHGAIMKDSTGGTTGYYVS